MKVFAKDKELVIRGTLGDVVQYLKELRAEQGDKKLLNLLEERLRSREVGGN